MAEQRRTILVVDDDTKTVDIVRRRLEKDGFEVLAAHDGETALTLARGARPDLIVLDLMLPRLDGLDVCHVLREEWESHVPIIMLTARATEEDTIAGLRGGADDYLTKPFSPRELSARVSAVLRRTTRDDRGSFEYRCGALGIDVRNRVATLGPTILSLTPTEFTLLATLMSEPGRTFTRLQLLDRVFGHAYDGLERTIDVHVTNLRKKIEPTPTAPQYIVTVYGVGYRLGTEGEANVLHP